MECYMLIVGFVLIFSNKIVNGAMSENQLKAATKLVRNVCQPKTKATNEDIDKMHQGNWEVDRTAMCYMYCSLNMNKLMTKENTFNYEWGLSLAQKNLPEARKVPTIKTMEECKNAAKSLNDKCAAAYEVSKCLYESNPSNYFLP